MSTADDLFEPFAELQRVDLVVPLDSDAGQTDGIQVLNGLLAKVYQFMRHINAGSMCLNARDGADRITAGMVATTDPELYRLLVLVEKVYLYEDEGGLARLVQLLEEFDEPADETGEEE